MNKVEKSMYHLASMLPKELVQKLKAASMLRGQRLRDYLVAVLTPIVEADLKRLTNARKD